ncbi:MAG: hypothetical protein A2020_00815 [Lentisphaerae bacterium GWF2_45_14]|nr:MAG: hypothetical protein A2020_00815 [Lentisphaerae bacterium GWF2_45_14]
MNRLSTSEEIKRLVDLPSKELLKEFSETRERFRAFLKESGINVPDIMTEDSSPGQDRKNSVLLDEFSLETISSIDDSIYSVFSTVGAFVKLFEKIPHSNILKHITVTVEGEEPVTAKDLNEKIAKGEVNMEEQIVVASSELRSLLPDMGGKAVAPPKSKAPVSAEIKEEDIKTLLEGKNDIPETAVADSAGVENEAPPEEMLSPIISQKEYDLVMSGESAATTAKEPVAGKTEEKKPEAKKKGMPTIKVGGPKIDAVNEAAPAPAADIGGNISEKEQQKENKEFSQNDLDEFLKKDSLTQRKADPSNISQDELEALLSDSKSDTENHKMSQEELDAYLAGEPVASADSALTQEELDALLVGKKKDVNEKASSGNTHTSDGGASPEAAAEKSDSDSKSSIDQGEIDLLLQKIDAEPQDADKELTLSQDELDELLARKDDKKGGATMSEAQVKEFINSEKSAFSEPDYGNEDFPMLITQDEVDGMLATSVPKKEQISSVSQSEIEEILQGKELTGDGIINGEKLEEIIPPIAELPLVSQSEIEEILQKKEFVDDGIIKGEKLKEIFPPIAMLPPPPDDGKEFPLNISQDELDDLIGKRTKDTLSPGKDENAGSPGITAEGTAIVLKAETSEDSQKVAAASPSGAMMSQDELDVLFDAGPSHDDAEGKDAGDEQFSKDEIDKLFS